MVGHTLHAVEGPGVAGNAVDADDDACEDAEVAEALANLATDHLLRPPLVRAPLCTPHTRAQPQVRARKPPKPSPDTIHAKLGAGGEKIGR